MDAITLAQSVLLSSMLKPAAFWAELDAATRALPAQVDIHTANARSYHLSAVQFHLSLSGQGVIASWSAESAVLDAQGRLELAQLARAWLAGIAALKLPAPTVAARVQAASSLLSAGFTSVSVQGTGQLINTPEGLRAYGQPMAWAA